MSRLEQVVEEIFEEEKVKEVKREQKRQKKRARRKEKCKNDELTSNEISEECQASKEELACEMKNGVNEEEMNCKVESCESNENQRSLNEEHCNYNKTRSWNGNKTKNTNSCSEKCPQTKMRDAGQNPCPNECVVSKCNQEVSCAEQESDKPCPELARDESSPGRECGKSYPVGGCGEWHSCRDYQQGKSSHSHESNHIDGCYQNGFFADENHDDKHDNHDNFPVDDEEKQLLLSMGWDSAEPCQVRVDNLESYLFTIRICQVFV